MPDTFTVVAASKAVAKNEPVDPKIVSELIDLLVEARLQAADLAHQLDVATTICYN